MNDVDKSAGVEVRSTKRSEAKRSKEEGKKKGRKKKKGKKVRGAFVCGREKKNAIGGGGGGSLLDNEDPRSIVLSRLVRAFGRHRCGLRCSCRVPIEPSRVPVGTTCYSRMHTGTNSCGK